MHFAKHMVTKRTHHMADNNYPTPPFSPQQTGELPGQEHSMDPRPVFAGEHYKAAGKL